MHAVKCQQLNRRLPDRMSGAVRGGGSNADRPLDSDLSSTQGFIGVQEAYTGTKVEGRKEFESC